MLGKALQQHTFLKGSVGDDGDAAIASERKNARFDLSIEDVVGDLDEVERMLAHDPLELAMTASLRGGDAYVADSSPAAFISNSVCRCASQDKRL